MEAVVPKLASFNFLNPKSKSKSAIRRFSSALCVSSSPSLTSTDSVSLGHIARPDFPILHQELYGSKKLVYLDNAATSQKPIAVLKALQNYYEAYNSNVHRGIHFLSAKATDEYELARKKVAAFINASDSGEIVFTRNATEAINLVAYSWGLSNLKSGDEVILTVAEHHSAIVPWQLVAQKTGANLKFLNLNDDESPDLDKLKEMLSGKTKLVVVHHISNMLGRFLMMDTSAQGNWLLAVNVRHTLVSCFLDLPLDVAYTFGIRLPATSC